MATENKLKKLKPNDDDQNAKIDADLVLSIEKLQEIQDDFEKINEKASDEVLEIEKKYNEMRQPVYDKRKAIIEAIPDFWLTAFLSHPALGELVVTDEDHKIFKHLTSIEVVDSNDVKSGYLISFNFSPNPYFEDSKLTKTFTFLEDGSTNETATGIKWKEGMGIPKGVDGKKKGNKRHHLQESFFSWFSETQQMDDVGDLPDGVAEIIKEDLWPNPLAYFNNDADEEDFEGDEEDGDAENEEDGDEDETEDDDE